MSLFTQLFSHLRTTLSSQNQCEAEQNENQVPSQIQPAQNQHQQNLDYQAIKQQQLTKKQKKQNELDQLSKEENEFLSDQKRKILQFIKKNTDDSKQVNDERHKLKQNYYKQSNDAKYKHNMAKRSNDSQRGDFVKATGQYSIRFLFLRTDDDVLYQYKRKLRAKIQWDLLIEQHWCVLAGAALFGLTRLLKKKSQFDGLYFLVPYTLVNYCFFVERLHTLYEIGYPSHPLIFQARTQVVNNMCYAYPTILKNEIEYLHSKIHEIDSEKAEEEPTKNRYEREFTAGKGAAQSRFKIIVQDGKIYLSCIDKFEDIFEISREIVSEMELTDILDPGMFENHKDITNALFDVYLDLGKDYIKTKFQPRNEMQRKALERIQNKYGVDIQEQLKSQVDKDGLKEATELIKSFGK
ncbi:UNKNOWN [Stylonychia lemnae]|uniref:Uncharacterized protein n=1 Tax=Stylonychia lemnae TaxID=5949 RepID=A0A077ZNZ5_STYLE|nr:UNKNOWN [Stylonychia lemnae]|eukprot:CDW71687.1 UNKNOWN [Stylonychia lemnae]